MYIVSTRLYEEIAARLLVAIGRDGYFSGSVAFAFEETDCKLTASLVICRRTEELPEGRVERISDVVPVWWEFSTVCEGTEVLNDFSFRDLKEFLL